jgi:predicted MFS family arabinose efflux permease
LRLRRSDLALFAGPFWWAISIAGLLSLARFSAAFLVLKAHNVGVDAAFVPIVLILMHLVYAGVAYPFGVLADRIDRRLQLVFGAAVLIAANLVLASATMAWMAAIGPVGAATGHHPRTAVCLGCRCGTGNASRDSLRDIR